MSRHLRSSLSMYYLCCGSEKTVFLHCSKSSSAIFSTSYLLISRTFSTQFMQRKFFKSERQRVRLMRKSAFLFDKNSVNHLLTSLPYSSGLFAYIGSVICIFKMNFFNIFICFFQRGLKVVRSRRSTPRTLPPDVQASPFTSFVPAENISASQSLSTVILYSVLYFAG